VDVVRIIIVLYKDYKQSIIIISWYTSYTKVPKYVRKANIILLLHVMLFIASIIILYLRMGIISYAVYVGHPMNKHF